MGRNNITPHSISSIRNSLSILTSLRWFVVLIAHSTSLRWTKMAVIGNTHTKATEPRMVPDTVMLNAQMMLYHMLKRVNLELAAQKWISGKPTKWQMPLLHILVQVKEPSTAKVLCVASLIDTMVIVTRMAVHITHISFSNKCSMALDRNTSLIQRRSLQW